MIAANYTAVRNNLKGYCDMASSNGETVIVTRKANKNVVIMSLDRYNLMEKAIRNAQYLAKLDRAFEQLYAGEGQEHELIEE
ncbi:MAG: type II toxin-antitoxin system Phd/YefM family antitoxin [Clostridia bacterium]|nr:type II toxin-antitoxin system Phd/YefM family antitoxin [Clostridia bacterium]